MSWKKILLENNISASDITTVGNPESAGSVFLRNDSNTLRWATTNASGDASFQRIAIIDGSKDESVDSTFPFHYITRQELHDGYISSSNAHYVDSNSGGDTTLWDNTTTGGNKISTFITNYLSDPDWASPPDEYEDADQFQEVHKDDLVILPLGLWSDEDTNALTTGAGLYSKPNINPENDECIAHWTLGTSSPYKGCFLITQVASNGRAYMIRTNNAISEPSGESSRDSRQVQYDSAIEDIFDGGILYRAKGEWIENIGAISIDSADDNITVDITNGDTLIDNETSSTNVSVFDVKLADDLSITSLTTSGKVITDELIPATADETIKISINGTSTTALKIPSTKTLNFMHSGSNIPTLSGQTGLLTSSQELTAPLLSSDVFNINTLDSTKTSSNWDDIYTTVGDARGIILKGEEGETLSNLPVGKLAYRGSDGEWDKTGADVYPELGICVANEDAGRVDILTQGFVRIASGNLWGTASTEYSPGDAVYAHTGISNGQISLAKYNAGGVGKSTPIGTIIGFETSASHTTGASGGATDDVLIYFNPINVWYEYNTSGTLTKIDGVSLGGTDTVDMGDGFTVTATTAGTNSTITESDTLTIAAAGLITTTATSDGVITIGTTATADQTGEQIKTAYEAEDDTNAFTDANVITLGNAITSTLTADLNAGANQIGFTENEVSNAASMTVDWGIGNKASVILSQVGHTIAMTNPATACNLLLKITQGDPGSDTITTWTPSAGNIYWAGGGDEPTLSTSASAIDIITFYFDGTNYYGAASLDFS